MYSMNALATLATIQLFDNRETPTRMPSMVAARMPASDIRMVLTMPTHNARPPVLGAVSMPSLMAKLGLTLRKSKPVLMSLALRLSPACLLKKYRAKMTTTSVNTWTIHLMMVVSR